jgi:Protein of unknown function (DUF3570)
MQLKRKRLRERRRMDIAAPLTAATCALLGLPAPGSVSAQEIGEWQIDTGGLYYGEADRVRDLNVSVLAKTQISEDKYLDLAFTLDTLTGASPNGAAPSASGQYFAVPITFTRTSGGATVQSGGGRYLVPAGELPLDPTFKDTRYAGSAHWQRLFARLTNFDVGGSVSIEHDYTHVGVDTQIAHDFNRRNTTLSGGIAWADDTVKPVGGSPLAFSSLRFITGQGGVQEDAETGPSSQGKRVKDLLLGLTQVLNRTTLVQINYSLSRSSGYLTDPYKVLSIVDLTGDLAAGPDAGYGLYLYESRPDMREKRSLYGLLKHDFNGNVLDASYRVMSDDWGVDSRTLDLHYRFDFGADRFLQPHLRFYSQTAADFYHTVLLDGEPLPQYATADSRLGKFDAVTLGVKYGVKMRTGQFSARFEVYRQMSQPSADSLLGSLSTLDLTPDLTAVIAQISYKFGW